jgi:hypothetical protein
MFAPNRALRLAVAVFVVTGGLIVASCGGGSVNTTPASPSTSSTQSVSSSGGTLSLPAASNGESASLSVAAGVPVGTTITASSSAQAPGSAPVPSSIARSTESISGAVPFLFVTFTVSQSFAAQLITGEAVPVLSNFPANAQYYVEFDDITSSPGTKLACAGPGTVSGQLVSISNSGAGGVCTNTQNSNPTLTAGHTYLAQFYYVLSNSASPTPSPSPSPSASPGFFTGESVAIPPGSCSLTGCYITLVGPPFGTTISFGTTSAPVGITLTLGYGLQTPAPNTYTAFTGTGTVEEYIEVAASTSVTVAQTPSIVVTGLTGVTKCAFYIFTGQVWASVSPSTTGTATVTNGSVTLPMEQGVNGLGVPNPPNPVNLNTTPPAYGAVACS